MRSTRLSRESPDDRSTKARIRDAAIDCVAEHGVAATTARRVAAAAGVSTGLVIHHFGSMDGLHAECDEYVAAVIRQRKSAAMEVGPGFDPLAAMRGASMAPLMGYLARALVDDSSAVNMLIDEMIDDAEAYMRRGIENGMLRPSDNPRGRAAVLTMWSLGGLVLHRHIERILGVDLTAPDLGSNPAVAAAFFGPALEIMGEGMLTESFARHVRGSFAGLPGDTSATAPSMSPSPIAPTEQHDEGTA